MFPLDRSDFIRTRLTHSLEVSSLAKSLGQNISESIRTIIKDETFTPEHKAAVCDILQCAGLIHDIGNPPFGHFGETAFRIGLRRTWRDLHLRGEPWRSEFWNPRWYRTSAILRAIPRRSDGDKVHFLVDEHGMNLTKLSWELLSSIRYLPWRLTRTAVISERRRWDISTATGRISRMCRSLPAHWEKGIRWHLY